MLVTIIFYLRIPYISGVKIVLGLFVAVNVCSLPPQPVLGTGGLFDLLSLRVGWADW